MRRGQGTAGRAQGAFPLPFAGQMQEPISNCFLSHSSFQEHEGAEQIRHRAVESALEDRLIASGSTRRILELSCQYFLTLLCCNCDAIVLPRSARALEDAKAQSRALTASETAAQVDLKFLIRFFSSQYYDCLKD